MRTSLNVKHSLLLGTSIATLALLALPALAQNNNNGGNETVIVTGTRVQGMTAADSAAPVTVLGSDALTRASGSQDLRQSLGQTVPSFTTQAFGGDLSNLTRAANLRGLSPNDTLVLVNGHRRHYTGNSACRHCRRRLLPCGNSSSAPTFRMIPYRGARPCRSAACWTAPRPSMAPTPSPAWST